MTISRKITNFALEHGGQFSRRELLHSFRRSGGEIAESTLAATLNRMVAHNIVQRTACGTYKMGSGYKREFIYPIDRFVKRVNNHVKAYFPFASFCVWQPSVLSQFMQHIPIAQFTLVDVERVAMEAVFDSLRASGITKLLLLDPSRQDCERYVYNEEVVIVRPLVSESPIVNTNDCLVPRVEKMLVDAIADKELAYMQGSEIYTIYRNAYNEYDIKTKRLLRYASRRNRKEKAEQILKTINL